MFAVCVVFSKFLLLFGDTEGGHFSVLGMSRQTSLLSSCYCCPLPVVSIILILVMDVSITQHLCAHHHMSRISRTLTDAGLVSTKGKLRPSEPVARGKRSVSLGTRERHKSAKHDSGGDSRRHSRLSEKIKWAQRMPGHGYN